MMDFDPAAPGPVPSPCISLCQMDEATGLCAGCQRTIDEIVGWGTASDDQRRAVWREIRLRRHAQFDDAAFATFHDGSREVPADSARIPLAGQMKT